MDPIIDKHREQLERLVAESNPLMQVAEAEARDLTENDASEIQANTLEFERITGLIKVREAVNEQNAALDAPLGRITEPDVLPGDDEGEPEPVAKPTDRPRAQAKPRQPCY